MVEDIFDVVNENDEVTGQQRRSVIHSGRLLHRAVHIWLSNHVGEVFLQKRSPTKDKNPNRWDSSCSGHVDSGETYDIAAVRELAEELGIEMELSHLQKIRKFPASRETGMEFVWVYIGEHDGPFTLNPIEIIDGRYWKLEEVDAGLRAHPEEFSGAFRHLWWHLRQEI